VELGGGRLEELQAPSCLLTEGEIAGRVLFLGTKRKLGHVLAGSMLDALSMATLMRRIVDDAHGYSPSANPEAQQWRLVQSQVAGRCARTEQRRTGGGEDAV
jgi:hypothetical protein